MNLALGKNRKHLFIATVYIAVIVVFFASLVLAENPLGEPPTSADHSIAADSKAGKANFADKTGYGIFKDNVDTYSGIFMCMLKSHGLNSGNEVIQRLVKIFYKILIPLYMILILLTGILFLWGTISPNSRAQTKTQLQKLIIGLILCGISTVIFDTLIEVNVFLVDSVLSTPMFSPGNMHWVDVDVSSTGCPQDQWNNLKDNGELRKKYDFEGPSHYGTYNRDYTIRIDVDCDGNRKLFVRRLVMGAGGNVPIVPPSWDPISGFMEHKTGAAASGGLIALMLLMTGGLSSMAIAPILCTLFMMMVMPFVVLLIRYEFCLLYGCLLPFTIFCQSFDFLKGLGDKLMKQTLTWIFLPVPMAVFVVLAKLLADSTEMSVTGVGNAFAGFAAWILIGASPMMITGMLGGSGAITAAVGTTMGNPRLVFLGNVLQGQSAASFAQAAFTAQRMSSRTQTGRDSAAGYQVGSSLPKDASTAQPPPPGNQWGSSGAGGGGQTGGDSPSGGPGGGTGSSPGGQGGPAATVGAPGGGAPALEGDREAGSSKSMFAAGISMKERAMRAAFGAPVEAGTPDYGMSRRQAAGLRFQQANGVGSTIRAVGSAIGANALSIPLAFAPPAGYFLRGMLRQTIHDWEIGKSLGALSWKMTGGWVTDPATGKQVYHRGWQSNRGIIDDMAKAYAEEHKGFKPGEGAPPAARTAFKSLPLTAVAALAIAPAAPVVGIALAAVGVSALIGGGMHLLGRRGARLNDEAAMRKKVGDAKKEKEKNGGKFTGDDAWKAISEGDKDGKRRGAFGWKEGMAVTDDMKDAALAKYAAPTNLAIAASGPSAVSQSLYASSPAGIPTATGGPTSLPAWDKELEDAVGKVKVAKDVPVPDPKKMAEADGAIGGTTGRTWETLPPAQQQQYQTRAATAAATRQASINTAEQGLEATRAGRARAYADTDSRQAASRRSWMGRDKKEQKRFREAAASKMAETPGAPGASQYAGIQDTPKNREAVAMHMAYEEDRKATLAGAPPAKQDELKRAASWEMVPQDEYMRDAAWGMTGAAQQGTYMRDAAWGMTSQEAQGRFMQAAGGNTDAAKQMALQTAVKQGNGAQVETSAKQAALTDAVNGGRGQQVEGQAKNAAVAATAGRGAEVDDRAQHMAVADKQRTAAQNETAWNQLKRKDQKAAIKAAGGEEAAKASAQSTLQARHDENWANMSKEQQDDVIVSMTRGEQDSTDAKPEVLAQAKKMAYDERSLSRRTGFGRTISKWTPAGIGRRHGIEKGKMGWKKRAAVTAGLATASVMLPGVGLVGAAAYACYQRGRRKGAKMSTNVGSVEHGRARRPIFRELNGGDAKIDDSLTARQNAPDASGRDRRGQTFATIVTGGGKTYSIEEDGVYESQNKWGTGRQKLQEPQAEAVIDWYGQNQGDASRKGTHETGSPAISAAREDAIMAEFGGSTPSKTPGGEDTPGLDQLALWSDKVEAGEDRTGHYGQQLQEHSDRIATGIMGSLSASERRQFGWTRREGIKTGSGYADAKDSLGMEPVKRQNERAGMRALQYFLQKRRAKKP